MAKKTFFFSHDANARNDEKILAVRMQHKMEGYGIYFAIIEKLLESTEYILLRDYNMIAFELRVSAEKVKSIIEEFGLFEFTECGKLFYSKSLIDRMEHLEQKREKRSQAGKKGAASRWKNKGEIANPIKDNGNAITMPSKKIAKKSKVKYNNTSNSNELLCETSQPHAEQIDYKALVDFFNSQTKGVFGIVQPNISEKRKGLIRARIREHGKEMFAKAIEKAYKSDYLKSGKFNCTFDWIIRPTNFEKIISGNYDNKDRNNHSEQGIGDDLTRNVLEGLARAEFEKQQR